MAQRKIAVWLYSIVSVICLIRAVLPMFAGGRPSLLLLACTAAFAILAASMRRNTPPAA